MVSVQDSAGVIDAEVYSKIGQKLYLISENADVVFIVENECIPAHKIILAAASDVFKPIFYGSLKEQDDIRIVGATVSAFKEFLSFFISIKSS